MGKQSLRRRQARRRREMTLPTQMPLEILPNPRSRRRLQSKQQKNSKPKIRRGKERRMPQKIKSKGRYSKPHNDQFKKCIIKSLPYLSDRRLYLYGHAITNKENVAQKK